MVRDRGRRGAGRVHSGRTPRPSRKDVEGFLRNAVPSLGAWFWVAWAAHTYHRPGWRSLLRNWIIAVPIGLLVRTVIVGSPRGARILVFVAVGLGFTALFLILGRLLARLLSRAR
ncbi:MAG: DUF3054 family protein [Actinomycetota bacterium]